MTELTTTAPSPSASEVANQAMAFPAPYRRIIFLVTALGGCMASLDLSIVNVAFPALERNFPHDSRATLAWVITGYSIMFGSFLVTGGRTADRIGKKHVFFIGMAVFCLGSVLCGVAPSVMVLIAGRLIQGVGAAAMLPASLGLLLSVYPNERRTQIVALWGGVTALAVATGPSLGALLVSSAGWRFIFFVNLPIAVLALTLGWRRLVESEAKRSVRAPDYLGAALMSAALGGLVLAISEGPAWGWTSQRTLLCVLGAAVLGSIFIHRSTRHEEPVLDFQLFSHRSFSVANVATVLYGMGFNAMLLGNVLFLTEVWHYSILKAGLAITTGPIVVTLVAGQAGRLAARFGFRVVLLGGAFLCGGGLTLYALRLGIHSDYLADWLPANLTTGLGVALTFPVLSAAAVSSVASDRLAVGSAVNQTARQVGGSIGVAFLVVILGSPQTRLGALADFRHLWLFSASMVLLSGITCVLLRSPDRAVAPLSRESESGPDSLALLASD